MVTSEKPTAAFVLSLIGGIFILLNALLLIAAASILSGLAGIPGMPSDVSGTVTSLFMVYAGIGLVFAIIVLVGAAMMWMKPQQHVMWGIIVLLFSLFSFIIGGGFFIGLILGLVGGILALIFKPTPPMMAPPGMAPLMPPP